MKAKFSYTLDTGIGATIERIAEERKARNKKIHLRAERLPEKKSTIANELIKIGLEAQSIKLEA